MNREEFEECLEDIRTFFRLGDDSVEDDLDTDDLIINELECLYEWACKPKGRGFGLSGLSQTRYSSSPEGSALFLLRICSSAAAIAALGVKHEEAVNRTLPRIAEERKTMKETLSKLRTGGSKGGKGYLAEDRDYFKKEYRAERGDNPSVARPRSKIVDGFIEHYPSVKHSTLERWAKDADIEDGFPRKGGRPKKGSEAG